MFQMKVKLDDNIIRECKAFKESNTTQCSKKVNLNTEAQI